MSTIASSTSPDATVILLPIIGAAVLLAGIQIIRHAEKVAGFFRGVGGSLYGQRESSRIYTAGNTKLGGIGAVVFGVLLIVVGVIEIIRLFG